MKEGGGGSLYFIEVDLQFLVQSFKETLQYCDEWRIFTSDSQSGRQSVSQSVSKSVIV